jgi:tRNA nucleotidyltransferase (CCA-adding enzyme)
VNLQRQGQDGGTVLLPYLGGKKDSAGERCDIFKEHMEGMDNIDFKLPEEVKYVIDKLNENCFEAVIVGGCVRDILLGVEPDDWDVATSALPCQTRSLFDKTVDVGLKYGTVAVLIGNKKIEVTTFRNEDKYSDNRRPDKVNFISSMDNDIARRDFTINSIAYHPGRGFIDLFNGIADIKARIIRTVGDADKRFSEDALRMLRAVRFTAEADFEAATDVIESIKKQKNLLCKVSKERVRDELTKILASPNPSKIILLKETGMLALVLPELDKHSCEKIRHIAIGIKNIENDPVLKWAVFLNEERKDDILRILKNLRFSNAAIKRICNITDNIHMDIKPVPRHVKKAVSAIGEDTFLDIIKVKEAILNAEMNSYNNNSNNNDSYKSNNNNDSILTRFTRHEYLAEEIKKINAVRDIYHAAKEKGECMSIKDLAVSGNDIINIGFKESKQVGEILEKLLDYVIENPCNNRKKELLVYASRFLEKQVTI